MSDGYSSEEQCPPEVVFEYADAPPVSEEEAYRKYKLFRILVLVYSGAVWLDGYCINLVFSTLEMPGMGYGPHFTAFPLVKCVMLGNNADQVALLQRHKGLSTNSNPPDLFETYESTMDIDPHGQVRYSVWITGTYT
ncbi:hypothetical protein KIPB_003499 [Kipferlia bialata]|uniref:Uncharacterized protein n=1 Tax=Kipferlia bialata TaxID=797122 RepID=A0A9K3GHH5_9EUKA|nr:hypothetical protein KIPB_003499 [Kipferlia bialata]|eukprot:g3499.t1